MRLYTFRTPDRPAATAGRDDGYDVMEVGADWTPRDIAAQPHQPGPAIQASGKVVCIGLNYRDHLEEQHLPMPHARATHQGGHVLTQSNADAEARP